MKKGIRKRKGDLAMLRKKRDECYDEICEYCEHAMPIKDEEHVFCQKNGIVSRGHRCRKFLYDPLKRKPRRMPPLPRLDEEA